ncbi:MAG: hypothetical protein ABW072_16290 [Sedimenticola sp.]
MGIDINYPAAFPDDYLRSEVRLEIGPLAPWLPYEDRIMFAVWGRRFRKDGLRVNEPSISVL